MIHVTRASSLSKAICHALGSRGGREHLWAPINRFLAQLLGEDSPSETLVPATRSQKGGTWAHYNQTHIQTHQAVITCSQNTQAHLSHTMSVLGGTSETSSSKPLISQTENLRPREITRGAQGHQPDSAKGGTWACVPLTA